MMNTKLKTQKGMGLIEILITTVVISVGVLAVASMQGTFVSESGVNKAKGEARSLAEEKIEEFRNLKTKTEFDGLATGNDTYDGQNAAFSRTWTFDSLSDPVRKSITVEVTWEDESIELSSEISWNPVGNASLYSSSGGGSGLATSLPSPSSNSAVVEAIDAIPDDADEDEYGFKKYRNDEGKYIVADDYGDDDPGTGRQLACEHVCLTVEGTIYLESASDFDTYEKIRDDDVTVCRWHSDGISDSVDVSGTSFASQDYICYYGGDCTFEPATYALGRYNECPLDLSGAPEINVPGGWRGNIGIVGFSNPTNKTLCFLGQVGGAIRRSYETTRTDDSSVQTQEGINTNYQCHDFLMITNSSGAADACDAYTQIQTSTVNRELAGTAPNTILTNVADCSSTSYEFSGIIIGEDLDDERASLVLSVNNGACQIGPSTGSPSSRNKEYTCTVNGAPAGTVEVIATSELDGTIATPSSVDVTLSDSITAPSFTLTAP